MVSKKVRKGVKKFKPQTLIPTDIRGAGCSPLEAVDILKKAGVVFGRSAGKNSNFRHTSLTNGLSLVSVKGSFFSNLVDSKGRVRARTYINGGVAHVDVCTRFSVLIDTHSVSAMDGTTVLHKIMLIPQFWKEEATKELRGAVRKVRRWLHEKYPDWEKPYAYWDED